LIVNVAGGGVDFGTMNRSAVHQLTLTGAMACKIYRVEWWLQEVITRIS
jgi:hypothetical protein